MIETVPSGTVLHGHFRIERVLGSGGFGHVYLAIDLRSNQQYAIKEYLVSGSSGQEQLQHEARVLSQLHHPNLPAFQDAFIENSRYYVVLNYIEGHDLTDLIRTTKQRNGVIPIGQMLGWVLSICDAVMFLHSQRPTVIHRDIKPDNIRIKSDGTAVLVDLGNAKAAADGARTLFFIRHQGTPGYAPPEQYPGGAGTDARSDVYALGGTLYFALTAQEPPSVSTRNQSLQQGRPDLPTLQEILANNPPEESPDSAARQFRLGVSKPAKPAPRHSYHIAQMGTLPPDLLYQLNRIIQRSLAMRPQDRYVYVADFANELKGVMSRLPKPPTPTRPNKDPNSTQPDLPELYNAIQAAKEQAQPDPSQAGTQPMDAGATTCPRCGSQLTIKAPYCPVCGAQLGGGGSGSSPMYGMQYNINAVAPDETVIMSNQQARLARMTQVQQPYSQNTPVSNPISLSGQQGQIAATGTPMPGLQPSTGPYTNTPRPDTTGKSLSPRLIIAGFILLLLIIAILGFLIFK